MWLGDTPVPRMSRGSMGIAFSALRVLVPQQPLSHSSSLLLSSHVLGLWDLCLSH